MANPLPFVVDAEGWTHSNCLQVGGFPSLLWDTLQVFGYKERPVYSACLPRCEVKLKVSASPLTPGWGPWEVQVVGTLLADTWQKAAHRALTTFCEEHPTYVALSPVTVFPLREQTSGPWAERLPLFLDSTKLYHDPEKAAAVRYSAGMLQIYQSVCEENTIYRHQVRELDATKHELAQGRAQIEALKKKGRKDKKEIWELRHELQDRNILVGHLEGQLQVSNHVNHELQHPPIPELEEEELRKHRASLELSQALTHQLPEPLKILTDNLFRRRLGHCISFGDGC